LLDAADVPDVPFALIALTVYVCAVPASCATVTDVPAVELVLPSDAAQTYEVIAEPPFAGAPQLTVSWLTPAVAVGADGVAGTVVAVMLFVTVAVEVPLAFVAVTLNV